MGWTRSGDRRWGRFVVVAAVALASFAPSARADDAVVVVVESADARVNARALRVAIARRGIPAYALSDDAAPTASGTLTVVVPRSGAVRMRFTDPEGHTRTRQLAADHRGRESVLARLAVRLVRESRVDPARTAREVLDPWSDQPERAATAQLLVEVLDPWSDSRGRVRAPRYVSEVIDPWAPHPEVEDDAPEVTYVASEVLDPWADENGRRLDPPRR